MIDSLYPCFKHWSNKGSVYIIGDTHFDDSDRIFMGYTYTENMQISILKAVCTKNDTLIHLGDVGNPKYLNELKCYKVLIMGNHDQSIKEMRKYFDEVYSGPLWISKKLVLSHEPLITQTWETAQTIVFNIHGHDHDGTKRYFHLNLAQNVYGYMPLNLNQFIRSGKLKKINDIHRATIDNAIARIAASDIFKEWYEDTGVENV